MNDTSVFKDQLKNIVQSKSFLSQDELTSFLNDSLNILSNEDASYRPLNSEGKRGGLLDFSNSRLPVIVVPDLHGRVDFLLRLLDFKLDGRCVLDLLNNGEVIVICVGDAVHGEARAYERWLLSYSEWLNENYESDTMKEEMLENLNTLRTIMMLKNAFTASFHFLKGNHENILNESSDGDYAFRKFVMEGAMCFDFMESFYGDDILRLISRWEKSLPICAVFSDFGVSHAEPSEVWGRDDIINCRTFQGRAPSIGADVILSFTWTKNGDAEDGSVRRLLEVLRPGVKRNGVLWFGGHRPVKDAKYYLRQGGAYLQLHNPSEMNIAIVRPGVDFDAENDIKSVI